MRLLNARRDRIPPGAVWIDRSGPWGNPVRLRREADRTAVLEAYHRLLGGWLEDPAFVARLRTLSTAPALVCWCAPKPCHGDLLIAAMERLGFLDRTRLFFPD